MGRLFVLLLLCLFVSQVSARDLVIAGDKGFIPFSYINAYGEPDGLYVEIWKEWAKENNRTVTFVLTDWLASLNLVHQGKADIHMGIAHEENNLLLATPFHTQNIALFYNKQVGKLNRIEAFYGKSIGVFDPYFGKLLQVEHPKIHINVYNDYKELLHAFKEHKIVGVFDSKLTVLAKLIEYGLYSQFPLCEDPKSFYTTEIFPAIAHNNTELLKRINAGFLTLDRDKIEALEEKWIISRSDRFIKREGVDLTNDEAQWLSEHKVIHFAGDPKWLPIEGFNKHGEYIGIVSDYLKIIEKRLGIIFEVAHTKTWQESVALAVSEQVDVLSQTVDKGKETGLLTTTPYLENPIVIVMRKSHGYVAKLEDIQEKKIAIIHGYGYANQILRDYPDIKFEIVENVKQGLVDVSTGKIDALLCAFAIGTYNIAEFGMNNIQVVGETDYVASLAFGVISGYEPFVTILNKTLKSIGEETRHEILNRWLKYEYVEKTDYSMVWKVLIAALLFSLWFIFWNRRLSFKVKEKTSELKELLNVFDENVIAFKMDRVGVITYASRALCTISKYQEAELLGQHESVINHPDDPNDSFVKALPVLMHNESWKGESKKIKKDAEAFWVSMTMSAEYDSHQTLTGYSCIAEDITAKKEVEALSITLGEQAQELRENLQQNERFNTLATNRELRMLELKQEVHECKQLLDGTSYYDNELRHIEESVDTFDESLPENIHIEEIESDTLFSSTLLKKIMEDFCKSVGVSASIAKPDGTIMLRSQWQKACEFFHRANSMSEECCIRCDHYFATHVGKESGYIQHTCENGLTHCSTPIIVENRHIATLFVSQFFITSPDEEYFTNQAKKFGFDVQEYLDALHDVPVIDEKNLQPITALLCDIAKHFALMILEQLRSKQNESKITLQKEQMKKSRLAALNLAEDAEHARSELESYKTHLEELVEKRTEEIKVQQKHIRDSIDYASLIQHSIIPASDEFSSFFSEYFVIWEPRDIVGGDVYLVHRLSSVEAIIMVMDCTGHGVAGAFVTMLIKALQQQAIYNTYDPANGFEPSKALNYFNTNIKKLLKQESPKEALSNVGFDGAILYINKQTMSARFASANISLFVVDCTQVYELKGDKVSIGYKKTEHDFVFTQNEFDIIEGKTYCLSTDGYIDQTGGFEGLPMGRTKFKKVLKEACAMQLKEQKTFIKNSLYSYQGEEERLDDMTVIGVRI